MTLHPTSEAIPYGVPRWLRQRLAARCGVLVGVVLVAWLVLLPVALSMGNRPGMLAESLAAAVCLISGLLALVVQGMRLGGQLAVAQVLLGMALRMSLPLVAAIAVRLSGSHLLEAGFLVWLIAFYFVGLLVEVPLALAGLPNSSKALKVS